MSTLPHGWLIETSHATVDLPARGWVTENAGLASLPAQVGQVFDDVPIPVVVINVEGVTMAGEIEALNTEVTETEGVEASAVALITGFAAYIEAHKTDPVALQSYVDRLNASANALGAAVAANPVPE